MGLRCGAPYRRAVYLVIALSGACALGAEVVWTRLLSLMLGGTVYTFSIILAVFLAGLGLGSGAGASLARRTSNTGVALGVCQLLLVGAIFLAAFEMTKWLPWCWAEQGASTNLWLRFLTDLARCAYAVLPAAVLWGMSFPLTLAAVAETEQDPGRLVGKVYGANTVGAIVGALVFSLIVIKAAGTQNAQRVLMGTSLIAAAIVFGAVRRARSTSAAPQVRSRRWTLRAIVGVGLMLVAVVLFWSVPKVPNSLVAYGRKAAAFPHLDTLFLGEGLNASVAVTESEDGARNLHVNGKVAVSTEPDDMRVVRMLAHLPAMIHPNPKSVLVVGCGAGITAGTFLDYPGVERIVICEIEPLIPEVAARFFGEANRHVLEDPRVEIVYDDARHFISTTREKFDVVTSDPIHPWMEGSAVLYTSEYFELVKQHLNPRGLVTQWVPLYESDAPVVKSEMATFFQVFRNGSVWGNESSGKGFDVVLLGGLGPVEINLKGLQEMLGNPDYEAVAESLREVGFASAMDLIRTYAGQAEDLQSWLAGAAINRDRNLRLQYLAGLAIESQQSDVIYTDLLGQREFPAWLVGVSEARRAALEKAWR